MGGTYLVIPDLQIPFHNQKALDHCFYLKRHFKIDNDHILCVGDEVDQYFGSLYKKDPDARISAMGEIEASIEELNKWTIKFPEMKVAISNHGQRWAKRASEAEIPSQMLRSYQDILKIPKTWEYKREWHFERDKHHFRMIHGMGYSGMNGHRTAALDKGVSTIIGHLHSHAGIAYMEHGDKTVWGFNVGCLIDPEALAFQYGKDSRFQPCLGAGVIFGHGKSPVWFPL